MDTRLTQDQLPALAGELSGWQISCEKLQRSFSFANFKEAMAFMLRASYEAEALGHHPNWSNVYATVDVQIWSHDRGGVTGRCVALAQEMQKIAAQLG